jgi:hypothetical protein
MADLELPVVVGKPALLGAEKFRLTGIDRSAPYLYEHRRNEITTGESLRAGISVRCKTLARRCNSPQRKGLGAGVPTSTGTSSG